VGLEIVGSVRDSGKVGGSATACSGPIRYQAI